MAGDAPPPPTGLSTSPKDWPEGSVQTEGGYTIVPEGETHWSIYAPGQKMGEEPMTRVHGDPHVTEADGTSWDFTKNSDFVLPDGTRIAATTSAQEGKSVTTGLDITNGHAHVSVTGVNTADPTTSEVQSPSRRGEHGVRIDAMALGLKLTSEAEPTLRLPEAAEAPCPRLGGEVIGAVLLQP
jgi:hypothetical protein